MTSTCKARVNDTKARIEADLAAIHPTDREDYVKELRTLLSQALSATRRSPHDKHVSTLDAVR